MFFIHKKMYIADTEYNKIDTEKRKQQWRVTGELNYWIYSTEFTRAKTDMK